MNRLDMMKKTRAAGSRGWRRTTKEPTPKNRKPSSAAYR